MSICHFRRWWTQNELEAFAAYALAFPRKLIALIDTYDTLFSGLPNFVTVALALKKLGYFAKGGSALIAMMDRKKFSPE